MKIKSIALLFSIVLFGAAANADNNTSTRTSAYGYAIHHNALTTDYLPPQVASAYKIQRSKNRGMLNVSVLHHTGSGLGTAVPAKVEVLAQNLIGQKFDIPMREIREGEAIYYIGDFPVSNRDNYKFRITVLPEGGGHSLTAEMEQAFYTD